MKCPNCKAESIVKKVYPENKEGIKDRRHQCCSCGNEFFSYQTVSKTLSAALASILLNVNKTSVKKKKRKENEDGSTNKTNSSEGF